MRRTPPLASSVDDDSADTDLFDEIRFGVDRSIASTEGDNVDDNDDSDDSDDIVDADDSDITVDDRDPFADDSDAPDSGDDPISAAFGDVVFDPEVDVVRVAEAMLDQNALRAESVDTDQRRRVGGHPAIPLPGRR